MKPIQKQPEPEVFRQWKQGESPDWAPDWSALEDASEVKKALKAALMLEQGMICGYCGIRIDLRPSHIEHIKPRERYPEAALAYENLLASCLPEDKGRANLHCGMRKGNWYEESRFISPLDPQCQTHFRFTADGAIGPHDPGDERAATTIQRLGLDCSRLNAHRKQAIAASGLFDEALSEDDLAAWAEAVTQRDEHGALMGFCFVIASVFNDFTSRVKIANE